MTRRVVITGMGWVTPLGHDIETAWQRILAGESGADKITLFDASTFPTTFGCQLKDFALANFLGPDAEDHAGCSRNTEFALAAGDIAWRHAGFDKNPPGDPTQVGLYLGGGEGPVDFEPYTAAAVNGCRNDDGELITFDAKRWANSALKGLDPSYEAEQDPNLAIGHLAVHFNAQGPSFNTLTACAASTQAIGEAAHLIRHGDADIMISGGAHSMLHPLGLTGFDKLTALSTRNDDISTASRPFDRTRDGFVLGEGAGIVILEELEHARKRGAAILAEMIGFGSTVDAFRITDAHDQGRGAIAAMRMALATASLTPGDVDYISAHGTSTEENDKIETLAIRELFGGFGVAPPVSSVKSMLGHLIAAAGAVELITCVLAIRDGMIPPTVNYEHQDPNCDLDYVPNEARSAKVRVALSNSFGFGGQNNTLAVGAFDD